MWSLKLDFRKKLDSQLLHLWVSSLHEWWQCVHLDVILQKNWIHNYYTCGAFFLPEQMQCEASQRCFFAKLESHLVHLNGFIPSWTDAMWKFKSCFRAKLDSHNWHLNGFFPSWTDAMWSIKPDLKKNLESHDWHLWGFFPSWTDAIWSIKPDFKEKLDSHLVHLNGLIPSWTDLMWKFKSYFFEKLESQIPQLNGFISSWTDKLWKEYLPNLLVTALLPWFFVYWARYFKFWLLAYFFILLNCAKFEED